jgi:hypothetical protein
MSKPDLTAIPYQLDEEAIAWVLSTIDSMSVDEKVGQLFINLNNRFDDDFVNHIVDDYHPGGMRYNHTDSASTFDARHRSRSFDGPGRWPRVTGAGL